MAKKFKSIPVAMPIDSPCSSYKPTKADVERERKYQAEDALRTIQRANEVKKDKDLMKDVKALVKEQMKAVSKF